jgi:hypothetical protein
MMRRLSSVLCPLGLALVAGCAAATPAAMLGPPPASAPVVAPAPPPAAVEPSASPEPSAPPEQPAPPEPLEPPTPEDDDIREAVLRHMFKRNASGQQDSARLYCIRVERELDPSPALLGRFARSRPKVVAASACSADASGVRDGSGARGLVFRIDRIHRVAPDRAEVDGGYFEGGLSASGNSYVVAREGKRWVVKSDRMRWISGRGGSAARG